TASDLPPRTEGRVLRVIERQLNRVTGLLRKADCYWYIIPDNPGIQQSVRLRDFDPEATPEIEEYHKVAVELDPWEDPYSPPTGIVVEHIGPLDDPEVGIQCLLQSYMLDERFPDEVEEAARGFRADPDADEIDRREDFRSWFTFTIDPEDARDFDDAVSLEKTDDGLWKLGVHIADVSHFVTPNSVIDLEAQERGTSVYLVDRVITMLPRHLTTEVCSLNPDVERLTFSAVIYFDEQAHPVRWETHRSVIHSKARLNYNQVQNYFDGGKDHGISEAVREHLDAMRGLARRLRRKRMSEGSLAFNLPEIKCVMEPGGEVKGFVKRTADEAYNLIEEFMLAANQCVARIIDDAEFPSLYRIHAEPDGKGWERMAMELAAVGINEEPRSQQELNRISKMVSGKPNAYMVNLTILRNMNRALYVPYRNDHFGLGFTHYTHFTSPIRRYPDLLVHRVLDAINRKAPPPYPDEDVSHIASSCSYSEDVAEDAERESLEIKRIEYYRSLLEQKEIGPFDAVIVSIKPKGLIIEVNETLQKGMVPFAWFTDDYYKADQKGYRAVGRHSKNTWRLGESVKVELVRVDVMRRLVDFRILEDGKKKKHKKGKQGKKGQGKGKRRRRS
ncbi:MAG: VacB/RNase II family 3'-5' exoribonuclease, partial [Verrucomicrobiota bacterium]